MKPIAGSPPRSGSQPSCIARSASRQSERKTKPRATVLAPLRPSRAAAKARAMAKTTSTPQPSRDGTRRNGSSVAPAAGLRTTIPACRARIARPARRDPRLTASDEAEDQADTGG